jgi:Leucine-rich repeat (LRR) protein
MLGELELLDVGNNPLRELPTKVGGLSNLTQLYAPSCGLAVLPVSLRTLSRLTLLNLNSNYLTELPSWIGELTGLRDLHLKANRISSFPDALLSLSQLRTLMIGGNPLSTQDLAWIIRSLPSCVVDYADAGLSPEQRSRLEAAIVAALTQPCNGS